MRSLIVILGVALGLVPTRAPAEELSTTVRAARPTADGRTTTEIDPASFAGEWRHLGELAAQAPGAVPLDFGGVLSTTTISLRGAGADQVAVLLGRTPLAPPAGGGFDLSRIPAALLGGVEVRRGADARLGAAAMGGALVLEPTKRSRAMISGGSLGTLGASGAWAHALDTDEARWKLLGAIDVRRSRGDFDYGRDPTPEVTGNDLPEQLERLNNDALLGSMLLHAERQTERSAADLLAFVSASDRGLPGPVYTPTPGARQRELSFTLRGGWHDDQLELPLTLRGGVLDTRTSEAAIGNGRQWFADVATQPAFRWEGESLRFEASALVGHESFAGESHGDQSRLRAGAGVELSKVRGRWTGSLAARGERWGDAWRLVPRLGGSRRLGRGVTLHGNAGGGFRPPSFGELYFASGPVLPNPNLVAERAWSGDAGLRFSRASIDLALTGFGGLYRDTIVYELFSGTRAKPFNVAGSWAAGVELEGRFKPRKGLLRHFELGVTGTFLRTASLVEGLNAYDKELPYRPRLRGTVRAAWKDERVRGAVELTSTSSVWANRANTRRVEGFHDLRVSGGVRLEAGFWLSAEVRNALDVRDRAVIEGYPLPGRIALAHVSWEPEDTP